MQSIWKLILWQFNGEFPIYSLITEFHVIIIERELHINDLYPIISRMRDDLSVRSYNRFTDTWSLYHQPNFETYIHNIRLSSINPCRFSSMVRFLIFVIAIKSLRTDLKHSRQYKSLLKTKFWLLCLNQPNKCSDGNVINFIYLNNI